MSPITEICGSISKFTKSLLLANEEILSTMVQNRFLITNLHIIEVDRNTSAIMKVPIGLIEKLYKKSNSSLSLILKIGPCIRLEFSTEDSCITIERYIQKSMDLKLQYGFNCPELKEHLTGSNHIYPKVDDYYTLLSNEFERLNFDPVIWRITSINKDFELSPTYPRYHITLRDISNEDLASMCNFRSQARFPTITYRSSETGAVLIRAGQPMIGLQGNRCIQEETFLRNVSKTSKCPSKKMVILDARPRDAISLYFRKGGGSEVVGDYDIAEHKFLNFPNMVIVQGYFELFREDIHLEKEDDSLRQSDWMIYISMMLESAQEISNLIGREGRSVLVHCTNGWDRTPQLSSLAKLVMDPFYRTCEGFKVLIEQEWRQMGHKFGERCATSPHPISKQYSPIFVQWLDSVHQLLAQFPRQFEFNENLLIQLAIHAYSEVFGNFYGNFMRERCHREEDFCDLWAHLLTDQDRGVFNEDFVPATGALEVRHSAGGLVIWRALYQHGFTRPGSHGLQRQVSEK